MNLKLDFRQRGELAATIRSMRAEVAEDVTAEFVQRHPDWLARYGERARQFGLEDASFHLDFLAGAIESGEVAAFRAYAGWAARMLKARAIDARFLAENFGQITRALAPRLAAPDAAIVDSFICSGVEQCLREEGRPEHAIAEAFQELTLLYTDTALRGARQEALHLLLEAIRQGYTVIDIYSQVLQNAMHRVGRLWEENRITVAQEHMATSVTQFALAHLYPLIKPPRESRGKVVVTGVAGEFHQVGPNMVADILEASGWDVQFLGTNTPVKGVLEAIESHQASILGISATMLFNLASVRLLVESVRARFGSRMRIMLGGAAFRSAPSFYKEVGADGCGLDLQAAVQIAGDLSSGPLYKKTGI